MKFTNTIIGFMTLGILGMLSSALSQMAWTETELKLLASLSLGQLGAVPKDASNAFADNEKAAELGQKLFFDKRLSLHGDVSCASCHAPEKYFSDSEAHSEGTGMTDRKAPTIVGAAFGQWFFWDGRADSQWAQALGPLESGVEHGGDRTQYVHTVFIHYKSEYEALFGKLPNLNDANRFPDHAGPVLAATANANWQFMAIDDREAVTRVFVNVGKAIAAYERKLNPGRSRFDYFVEKLIRKDDDSLENNTLSDDETAGLRLFIGKAACISCHNGALFSDGQFHNTGVPTATGLKPDLGRGSGLQKLANSEFSCRSKYSDALPGQCASSSNTDTYDGTSEAKNMNGAFKTPSLRSANLHAPFMHAGQFNNLGQVLNHYNNAPQAPTGSSELKPLELSNLEMQQLEAFLKTLQAPVAADIKWLTDPFGN